MSNTTSRSHTPNSEPRSPKLEEDENGEGVDGEDGYESVDEKPKSGRAIDLWADDEDVKKDEEIEDGSLGGEGDTEDMGVIMHGTRRSSSHQVEMSRSPSTQGLKPSLSSTSSSSSSSSSSSTPHTKPNSRKRTPPPSSSSANLSKKPKKPEPQLIGDLPRAEEAALKSFVEIEGNHYQYGTLGRSREALESMTCDCQYEHGQSPFSSLLLPPSFPSLSLRIFGSTFSIDSSYVTSPRY